MPSPESPQHNYNNYHFKLSEFLVCSIAVVLMKLFQYFAGNLLGENGKPAMDADKLKDMAHKTKLVDDKLTDTDINDIFNKVKGKAK